MRSLGAALAACIACALAVVAPAAAEDPVVLIGTGGVMWEYINEADTPHLYELSQSSDVGVLNVRGAHPAACPADGWLTLGAGERAGDGVTDSGACRILEAPIDGVVPHWDAYTAAAQSSSYSPDMGQLGELAGDSVALGPGAAIALADADGRIANYGDVDELAELAPGRDLIVVDLGAINEKELVTFENVAPRPTGDPLSSFFTEPDWDEERIREQMIELDARLGGVLDDVERSVPSAEIIVASLSDYSRQTSTLQVIMRASGEPGLLTSSTTRRDGLVTKTDLLPTLVEGADGPGSPMSVVRAGTYEENRAAVTDLDLLNRAIRPGPVYVVWGVLLGLALIGSLIARRVLHGAALTTAALPAANVAMNLVPWHRSEQSTWLLLLGTVLLAAAAGFAALSTRRHGREIPAAVIAGATLVALLGPVLFGSPLALNSAFGALPQVGRFYGMTNMMFAITGAAAVVLAGVLAVRAADRRRASLHIALLGIVVIVISGSPWHGTDFGGPPVLTAAFLLIALLTAGHRVAIWTGVGLVAAGIATAALFVTIDYLRPVPERTHLGDFGASLLDGSGVDIIARKAMQVLGLWPVILLVLILAAIIVLLARARGVRNPLDPEGNPWAWAAVALAIVLGGGMLINDSGPIIVLAGGAVALPLIASAVSTSDGRRPGVHAGAPRRSDGEPQGSQSDQTGRTL